MRTRMKASTPKREQNWNRVTVQLSAFSMVGLRATEPAVLTPHSILFIARFSPLSSFHCFQFFLVTIRFQLLLPVLRSVIIIGGIPFTLFLFL